MSNPLYEGYALEYMMGGQENNAILDMLTTASMGIPFSQLSKKNQNLAKVGLMTARSLMGIGSDRDAAAGALHTGALSGGLGSYMALNSGISGIDAERGATLAAAHIADRVNNTGGNMTLSQRTGLSDTLIDGMLAEQMRTGQMRNDIVKQIRIKDMDDLRDVVEHGRDGYTLSTSQLEEYEPLLKQNEEYNATVVSKMNNADVLERQGKKKEAEQLRNEAQAAHESFVDKYGEEPIQAIATMNSGTNSITGGKAEVFTMVEKGIAESSGVIKRMSKIFNTENFEELKGYAKLLGVNTMATSKDVSRVQAELEKAESDAAIYGMTQQQALQNRMTISNELKSLYGGRTPAGSVDYLNSVVNSARVASNIPGVNVDEQEQGQAAMSRLADNRVQAGEAAAIQMYLSENADATDAAAALNPLLEGFRNAKTTEQREYYQKMLHEVAATYSVDVGKAAQDRAMSEGYGEDFSETVTSIGVKNNIAQLVDNGAFMDTMHSQLRAAGVHADNGDVKDALGFISEQFGSDPAEIKKYVEQSELFAKGKISENEYKDYLRGTGMSEEAIASNMSNGYAHLAKSTTFKATAMRLPGVDGMKGLRGKTSVGKSRRAWLSEQVNRTENGDDYGINTQEDMLASVYRGLVGIKDIDDRDYVGAALSGNVSGVAAGKLTVDTDGKISVDNINAVDDHYSHNADYYKERGIKSSEELMTYLQGKNLEDVKRDLGLTLSVGEQRKDLLTEENYHNVAFVTAQDRNTITTNLEKENIRKYGITGKDAKELAAKGVDVTASLSDKRKKELSEKFHIPEKKANILHNTIAQLFEQGDVEAANALITQSKKSGTLASADGDNLAEHGTKVANAVLEERKRNAPTDLGDQESRDKLREKLFGKENDRAEMESVKETFGLGKSSGYGGKQAHDTFSAFLSGNVNLKRDDIELVYGALLGNGADAKAFIDRMTNEKDEEGKKLTLDDLDLGILLKSATSSQEGKDALYKRAKEIDPKLDRETFDAKLANATDFADVTDMVREKFVTTDNTDWVKGMRERRDKNISEAVDAVSNPTQGKEAGGNGLEGILSEFIATVQELISTITRNFAQ